MLQHAHNALKKSKVGPKLVGELWLKPKFSWFESQSFVFESLSKS